jgi:hypothetical protein
MTYDDALELPEAVLCRLTGCLGEQTGKNRELTAPVLVIAEN